MPGSDSSSLSEALPSDDELLKPKSSPKLTLKLKNGKLNFSPRDASPKSSPEPDSIDHGREASPPHEYVLADNQDIAIIVIFRSRFSAAFPPSVPNVGPQDIEDGVVSTQPGDMVEDLLCGLLGLVLNRKKNPERGHYNRAVEEALSSQKNQWPASWKGINPIPSSKTFSDLDPAARINFLKTLVHWSLTASEVIQATIKGSYKQNRHEDDVNQPLAVQAWGMDTRKRKHYLVDGQVDAPFRIYRESARKPKEYTWWSVAGTIDDAQKLARNLRAEPGQAPHRLAAKITQAIPLFEERLEKRKRREYRVARRAAFARPEPGMSLYEGRTRGKRMNYNYDYEDVYGTDETSTRRSGRQSRNSTPADGPTFTASGRAVRSQYGRSYGEPSGLRNGGGSSTRASSEISQGNTGDRRDGRASRSGRATTRVKNNDFVSEAGEDDDGDVAMSDQWDGDEEDVEGDEMDEDSAGESEDSLDLEEARSLVVRLRAGPRLSEIPMSPAQGEDTPMKGEAPNGVARPAGLPAPTSTPNANPISLASGPTIPQAHPFLSQPPPHASHVPMTQAIQNPPAPAPPPTIPRSTNGPTSVPTSAPTSAPTSNSTSAPANHTSSSPIQSTPPGVKMPPLPYSPVNAKTIHAALPFNQSDHAAASVNGGVEAGAQQPTVNGAGTSQYSAPVGQPLYPHLQQNGT